MRGKGRGEGGKGKGEGDGGRRPEAQFPDGKKFMQKVSV